MNKLVKYGLILAAAYLAIAGGGAVYLLLSGRIQDRTSVNDPVRVASGEALYARHCASCHGADLKGESGWEMQKADGTYPAPPQDSSGHTWEHSDRQLFDYINEGGAPFAPRNVRSNMPGFRHELTEREIWDIITFVKSRWPEEVRKAQLKANFVGGLHNHR